MRGWGVALIVLAMVPFAAGQAAHHEHSEAMVVIAHDTPADGRTVVGDLTHFAVILFGKDGLPAFHHDMAIEVKLNGVSLFATTPSSGHDYDGVNGFDVIFPVPGNYTITATTQGSEGESTATFSGYVDVLDAAVPASMAIEGPDSAMAGEPATFTYQIVDADGKLLPHTDVVVEAREAGYAQALLYRVHTHSHEDAQTLQLAFPRPGDYELSFLGYTAFATADAPEFPAFLTTKRLSVQPPPAAPALMPRMPRVTQELNAVGAGESAGDYAVFATYDPYTAVGPFAQARLSTLVINTTTFEAVQHINFAATLTDSLGNVLFQSESLHEYDGILEVLAGEQLPGNYHLAVEATRGAWKGSAALDYTVAPPAAALSVGPQFTDVTGLDGATAGTPTMVELFIHDAAGMPFSHGEVDVQLLPAAEGAAPILATKLHTHDDGKFAFSVTYPVEGDYVLRLAPFALEPRPTPLFFGPGVGDALDFPIHVGAGVPLPLGTPLSASSTDPAAPARVPGPELAFVGMAFAGAALLATRRR
jgi:PKD repeat protein